MAWAALSGRRVVAHHGIQRSATNYLLQCLKSLEVPVANAIDPARDQPRHKHFRWSRKKGAIPPFIRHQFGNTIYVESVEELNAAASYPHWVRHVVVRKDRRKWLKSILNWGLKCDWFADKEEALGSAAALLADYDAYYGFWEEIERRAPDQVALLPFEKLVANPMVLKDVLDGLGVPYNETGYTGVFDEVPMSPKERPTVVLQEDVDRLLDAGAADGAAILG